MFLKMDIQMFADGKVVIDTDLNTKQFESGLSKMGSLAKSGFSAMATGVLAVSGTIATGLTAVVGAGVKSYADLEQNLGGIETLFKGSADTVIKNAEQAYKTAGISANTYMENVTSFSASLLQSLGGDTEAAAKISDMAMRDMSDNANKMGTDMETIIATYQSLARGNYAMLDNLKLGYGGTKEELQRLIDDVNAFKEANGEAGDLTIDSYSDIIEAIHTVQENMDITGTTAKEAATTISGSMNMAKAAWDNFLNGSGDIDEFVDAGIIAIENLARGVSEVAPSILDGLIKMFERLAPEIPKALSKALPQVVSATTDILNSIVDILPDLMKAFEDSAPMIIEAFMSIFMQLSTTLLEMLPQILQIGIELIVQLANGIAMQAPTLVPLMINTIINLVMTILDNIDLIVDAGINLILGLAQGLMNALPTLIEKIPEIISKLLMAISNNLPKFTEMGIKLILMLIEGIVKSIPSLLAMAPQLILSLIGALANYYGNMLNLGKNMVKKIADGFSNIKNIGKDLIKGLWNGIKGQWNKLKNKVEDLGKGIVKKFKSVFGIKSPSRVFRDQIGKYLPLGMEEGFDDELGKVYSRMQDAINFQQKKLQANVETGRVFNTLQNSTPITMTLNPQDIYLDKQKVGRAITPTISKTLKTAGVE